VENLPPSGGGVCQVNRRIQGIDIVRPEKTDLSIANFEEPEDLFDDDPRTEEPESEIPLRYD
jgi:hypothetical protein